MDRSKPTVQLLGRWQPWHRGHTELFKRAYEKTQQVVIQVRCMPISDQNPYDYHDVRTFITKALKAEGFTYGTDYEINDVPNIVDISYGRDVGYKIEQEVFDNATHEISATKIREQMREEGKL